MGHVSSLDSVKRMAQDLATREGAEYQIYSSGSGIHPPLYWFKRTNSHKNEIYPWSTLECTVQPAVLALLETPKVSADLGKKIDTWA